MAYCDNYANFDDFLSFENKDKDDPDYQPDLYYYWHAPYEEDLLWQIHFLILIVCVKSVLISKL